MPKPLKILLILLAIPVVLAVAAVVFILTLDPNRLKPLIIEQAAKQGIALEFKGDLGWQFYPALGVSLGAMSGTSQSGAPLFELKHAATSVQLRPLFSGSIQVQGVELEGVNAYFHVDKNGTNNWADIGNTQSTTAEPESASTDSNPPAALAVHSIHFKDLTLDYKDASTDTRALLGVEQAQIENFNLTGTPFPLSATLQAQYNDFAPLRLEVTGPVKLNTTAQSLQLEQTRLTLQIENQTATINLSNRTQWSDPLRTEGTFALENLNPKALAATLKIELPATAKASALTRLNARGDYQYSPEAIAARNLTVVLDDTTLKGELNVAMPPATQTSAPPAITTAWQLNRLNVDDYLPPKTEQAAAEPEQPTPPTELPLEPIRTLTLDARLQAGTLIASGYTLTDTQVAVKADQGIVNVNTLQTTLAEGSLLGKGSFDARGPEAKLAMTLDGNGLQTGPLLQQAADFDKLSGPISFDAQLNSQGATDQALMDNLNLTATARSDALQLVPINLEKTFCQAMAALQRKQLPAHDWPELTRLQPLEVNIAMQGPEVNLTSLSAQIAKLTGDANGSFNLDSGKFNVPLKLTLGDFAGDISGCLPIPDEWRSRYLPIRCKGSLDDIGPTTCLPDTRLLEDLIKEKANVKLDAEKARLERKLDKEQDRAEDKLKDKAQELLDKNVKEEDRDAVEQGVRNLLDNLKKKKD